MFTDGLPDDLGDFAQLERFGQEIEDPFLE
jgi:hypothetical protein